MSDGQMRANGRKQDICCRVASGPSDLASVSSVTETSGVVDCWQNSQLLSWHSYRYQNVGQHAAQRKHAPNGQEAFFALRPVSGSFAPAAQSSRNTKTLAMRLTRRKHLVY